MKDLGFVAVTTALLYVARKRTGDERLAAQERYLSELTDAAMEYLELTTPPPPPPSLMSVVADWDVARTAARRATTGSRHWPSGPTSPR